MSDRGVSEVLGFVLVFTLVTAMIGVVFATGIGGLSDAQDREKFTNVERAFDVLADNIGDLHQRGAPSRATEVKLAGGAIAVNDSVRVRIWVENGSDPLQNGSYQINPQPIVYEHDNGDKLLYVGGAVFRAESSGSVMVQEPRWVVGGTYSIIPLIETYGSGTSGVAGGGKVLIIAERGTRTLQTPFEVNGSHTAVVNVTVRSPRVDAWKRYFEDEGLSPVDSNPDHNNVTYQFETEKLYVPKTGVEVSFDR